ncbi:MAG: hypothetical protein ACOZNI_22545 [Myxococcota bacterium]
MHTKLRTVIALAPILACAARTPGAEPRDMGAARHEEEARRQEEAAAGHAGAPDPAAAATRVECGTAGFGLQVCWTSVVDPTEAHLRDAERHRRMAADHRARARARRLVEPRAATP